MPEAASPMPSVSPPKAKMLLVYAAASVLALAAPHSHPWAQGQREQMQQWLKAHCWVNAASPECREAVVRKQSVGRPGTFHTPTQD